MYHTPQLQKIERIALHVGDLREEGIREISVTIEMEIDHFNELQKELKEVVALRIKHHQASRNQRDGIGITIFGVHITIFKPFLL